MKTNKYSFVGDYIMKIEKANKIIISNNLIRIRKQNLLKIFALFIILFFLFFPNIHALDNLNFLPAHSVAYLLINLEQFRNNDNLATIINEEIRKLETQKNPLYLELKEVVARLFSNTNDFSNFILAIIPFKTKLKNVENKGFQIVYYFLGNFNLEQIILTLQQENKDQNKISIEKNSNSPNAIYFREFNQKLLLFSPNLLCLCPSEMANYITTSYFNNSKATISSSSLPHNISEYNKLLKQTLSQNAFVTFCSIPSSFVKKEIYPILKELKITELVNVNNVNINISLNSEKLCLNAIINTPSVELTRRIAGPIQNFINEVCLQLSDQINRAIKTLLASITYSFENNSLVLTSSISGNVVKKLFSELFDHIFTLTQDDMMEYHSNLQFNNQQFEKNLYYPEDDPLIPNDSE